MIEVIEGAGCVPCNLESRENSAYPNRIEKQTVKLRMNFTNFRSKILR